MLPPNANVMPDDGRFSDATRTAAKGGAGRSEVCTNAIEGVSRVPACDRHTAMRPIALRSRTSINDPPNAGAGKSLHGRREQPHAFWRRVLDLETARSAQK